MTRGTALAKRALDQYRGRLSAAEIAAGINAAATKATRLLEDAKLLLEAKRFPSASSIAVLAIEEAGKKSMFREMATAKDDAALKMAWRRYRDHRAKNVTWIIGEFAKKGAKTMGDLLPIFDDTSDHPDVLDSVKQLGFYTDCYKKGYWSEPEVVVSEDLARSMVSIAEILCKQGHEVTEREIELWIEILGPHMGTPLMLDKLIEWHEAMLQEGLTNRSIKDLKGFVFGEPKTGNH